jgi:predicted MFS family arabinose efflux permease
MLAPLKRSTFRTLWAGMGLSYAGDRLQELAQGWLVATLTGSALAVGGIGVLSSIPMLLMPFGGVIADQVDRRRLLLAGQWAGAFITGIMAILAFSHRIAVWHIYLWAFISGLVWMVIRPAYKVIVTEAVPAEEVRPAISLNSITETSALVVMNTGGSALINWLGLPVAFLLNSASYLAAILCLGRLQSLRGPGNKMHAGVSVTRLFTDLKDGLVYLANHKGLLQPLLFTLVGITLVSPLTSLLAAIVYENGGSLVQLGLLGGAASLGALSGAVFAGMKSEGNPLRTYSLFGLLAAAGVAVFAFHPVDLIGGLALYALGFLAFAQAVWNTSRVPRLAEQKYQARLQSLTSMAFTLGTPLGALWGGVAVDRFGLPALITGAGILAILSGVVLFFAERYILRIRECPDDSHQVAEDH